MSIKKFQTTLNGLPVWTRRLLFPQINRLSNIFQFDVLAKDSKVWYSRHCFPSEPVFVPALGGSEEDDGVILSAVVGTRGKKSFLLILDAKTFDEVTRAVIDCQVTHSLHGMFHHKSPITPGSVKRAWPEA